MAASHKLTGREARRCQDRADVFEDDDSRDRLEADPWGRPGKTRPEELLSAESEERAEPLGEMERDSSRELIVISTLFHTEDKRENRHRKCAYNHASSGPEAMSSPRGHGWKRPALSNTITSVYPVLMGFLFDTRPTPTSIVNREDALPGRDESILPHPKPHTVRGTPIDGPWKDGQRSVVVGLGCFWGAEKLFWSMDGVESTAVGYAGGYTPNPTYREVCTGRTGHAETVRIIYDPHTVSFEDLIRTFFEAHDPTQGFRQGNDVGTQYRSVIYAETDDEVQKAREIAESFSRSLADAGYGSITTDIALLSDTPTKTMYLAEDEHQQYLDKNPNGYCPVHSTGVACR